jgi:hypothetical protein
MGKRGEQGSPKEPTDKDAPSDGGSAVETSFPVHEHVGRRLKEMFDEVTTQPIPDKFLKLLEALEQKQSDRPAQEAAKSAPSKPKRKPRKTK